MRSRSLLFQRDFGLYWFSAFAATSGMWMWRVVSPVLVYELTGSTVMLGVLSLASYGPILALSFVGGLFADRFPRRQLISITHGVLAALFFGLAVLSLTDRLTAAAVIVAAIVEGAIYALAKPALQVLVTELVPASQLSRAVAVNTARFSLSQLTGPGLAAASLFLGGPAVAMVITSVSYVPIVLTLKHVRSHHSSKSETDTGRWSDLLRGGFTALRVPGVTPLLLVIALGSIAIEGSVRVLAPSYATTVLGLDESAAGLLIGGQALGAVAAVLVIGLAERFDAVNVAAWVGYLVSAVAIVVYAASSTLLVALVASGLVGLTQGVGFSISTSLIHQATEPAVRGRVMAFHAMALLGVRPVAGVLAGVLAAAFGTRIASAGFALVAVLAAWGFARYAAGPPEAGSGPDRSSSDGSTRRRGSASPLSRRR